MASLPPTRANTDTFSAADYNALANALLNVLKFTNSLQLFSRPTEVRIGGTTVYMKQAVDGSLIFYDAAEPGGKKLKDLIGAPADPWYLGVENVAEDYGVTSVANAVYLWPFQPPKTCVAMAIRDLSHGGLGMYGGIYNDSGDLLASASWTQGSAPGKTVYLDAVVTLLSANRYWLGWSTPSNAQAFAGQQSHPSRVKKISGTGGLPASLTIPSDWFVNTGSGRTGFPALLLVLSGGLTF
jgi:hypothetical protein